MTSFIAFHVILLSAINIWTTLSGNKLADDNLVSYERRLYDSLLENYEKAVRPVNRTADTVVVKTELALIGVDFLDEETNMLSTNVYLRMTWKDFQLIWDEKQYDNISYIRIPTSSLWTPDITVYNGAGEQFSLTSHMSVVWSNGDVLNVSPLSLSTRCMTDARYFPYDQQICHIKYGSWTYSQDQIDLRFFEDGNSTKMDLSYYVRSGSFDVIDASGVINAVQYTCCQERYIDITYTLTLQRLSSFATHLFLAPSVALSLIIPTIFILPVDSKERTTLGIGVLIAHTLLLGELIRYVPAGHKLGMPIMSQFFLANIVLVALSLVVSTAVINVSSRAAKNAMGPGAVVQVVFLNTFLTKILCVQPDDADNDNVDMRHFGSGTEEIVASDPIQLNEDRIQIIRKQEGSRVSGEWRTVAAVIDRLFLIAFFVVIVVLCLSFLRYL